MKKILSFMLLATLVVALAACKTTTTTKQSTTAGTTAATTAETTQQQVPLTYPTGTYNYRFASSEVRNTFFAAAEKYLLNNQYGGIPVFANAGFNLYSSRLQLPINSAIPVMVFGAAYSTMSADDTTVKMEDGQPGNAGEYTYRLALANDQKTLFHWKYDDATSSDVITWFLDAPYTYKFNSSKTGYELVPSMAASNPQPQNSTTLETGLVVSKVWRMPIRQGLKWTYHANTDLTGMPAGHEKIDANDFYETYRLALTNKWFRAITGGGDFLNQASEIKGAKDFNDGKGTWENVGIKKIDDYTIEFEFVNDMSEWNVRYWLGSFVMGPINVELYNKLQNGTTNTYGTSPETTVYNGPYKLDYFEDDKLLRYSKNPNYHSPQEYFFTHVTYSIIPDAEIRFQEFVDGKLEVAALPVAKYDQFKNHPGLKRVPGATTFRLMINGLGTEAAQKAQFPDSTYKPEPILANQDFKKAMYFAIDRKTLAEGVMKTSQTQMFHFTDAYIVDASTGIPFRSTPQAQTVGEGLSVSTNGYNKDLAVAYWNAAIDALVANGTYQAGTAANPTEIAIDLRIFTGSEAQTLFGQFIENSFESTFNSTKHNIKVNVSVTPTAFPDIYYEYMMKGEFDISIGGISGSTLDAASFLDVYASDNRGGFTLNWGIDTSKAEIEVTYVNPKTGETVREMWSYDAICSVLNGSVEVANGVEVEEEEAAE